MHETAALMQMDEPMATLSVMQSAKALNYIKRMRTRAASFSGLPRFVGRFRGFRTHSSHTRRQKGLTRAIMYEGTLECS